MFFISLKERSLRIDYQKNKYNKFTVFIPRNYITIRLKQLITECMCQSVVSITRVHNLTVTSIISNTLLDPDWLNRFLYMVNFCQRRLVNH